MKGKLVKRSNDRFDLYSIEDKNQINTIASSFDNPKGKLSLKNCQAIELGYDLNELAMGYDLYEKINFVGQMRAYKEGFQKALEILGDKKFTENNIDEAFDTGYEMLDSPKKYNDTLKDFKESLEQTEWDVEILCLHTGNPKYTTNTGLPKLDENGCLILKRL
jgi:hypothetical protein